MIKNLLNIILLVNITLAQDAVQHNKTKDKKLVAEKNTLYLESNLIDYSKSIHRNTEVEKYFRKEFFKKSFLKVIKKEDNSFDLISSVGSNMSFGGVWEKYAVINFTPQLFIQPADFINIYANHYLNVLIPLESVKEYSQSIMLQGLAILVVDNSMKLFLNSGNSWVTEVITFAAKNLLLNILIKPSVSNTSNSPLPVLQYENYFYSMSITF
ncbi:MAG: hypothetical protein IPL53_12125 [Ignavibacteria bacterium]|nr:hypothetical protein [Ignavibacteria bacterium]